MAADLVEQTADAERTRDRGDRRREKHARQTADLDDELHLVGLMHADAGGVMSGERRKRLCPETGMRVLQRADVVGTHAHDLRCKGQAVARLIQRQHIAAHEFRLVFARLDEMGMDGVALIAPAVLSGQNAAVIINDAVFFLARGFLIARSTHVIASLADG